MTKSRKVLIGVAGGCGGCLVILGACVAIFVVVANANRAKFAERVKAVRVGMSFRETVEAAGDFDFCNRDLMRRRDGTYEFETKEYASMRELGVELDRRGPAWVAGERVAFSYIQYGPGRRVFAVEFGADGRVAVAPETGFKD